MLNVLVVDDSFVMRQKIKKELTLLGHTVLKEAKTGKEAILSYDSQSIDFVTMDVTMPDMDGLETTRILKRTYPDIKIIMITSHGKKDFVREAIMAGAKGYVLKPVTRDNIKGVINKLFKNKEEDKKSGLLQECLNDEIKEECINTV